ncbi:MAG TPA: hypothetical protein VEJ38_06400 [Candidatus Acidoferrales bacterium]|nr:hypothetical protein [Candidatus Acidoferrales bacterium]
MSPKTSGTTITPPVATIKSSAGGPSPAELAARWKEARQAYPLYAALAKQFNLASLPYPDGEVPPVRPTRATFDSDMQWLDALDQKILAFQLRQLPPETLNGNEESLRALIQRQLRKPDKTNADRDKLDLLLVQYFALRASDEEDLVHKEITLEDVARLLQPVLAQADPTPLEWCEPLEQILEKTKHCHSLRDLMEDGLLEKGRMLKDSAGPMFYDPAALVAFCRFNFLLRRAFIRMLHADLKAVRETVDKLEAAGVKTVDCREAGFSAAETTAQLRFFSENWRQPFQKDYTHSSVHRAFEQLLAVRAAIEEALARKTSPPKPAEPPAVKTAPAKPATASSKAPAATADSERAPEAEAKAAPAAEKPGAAAPKASRAAAASHEPAKPPIDAAIEAEKCMETIWEQLIAAPPSRGRSMSTVVLQDTKVLLSSWEVAAFVSEGNNDAEDLRRAVVARAMLSVAADKRKRSGDESELRSVLAFARTEVSYFQGRVEQSKKAKNTEAAVNLGISTKRLLSIIEEAEGLQS